MMPNHHQSNQKSGVFHTETFFWGVCEWKCKGSLFQACIYLIIIAFQIRKVLTLYLAFFFKDFVSLSREHYNTTKVPGMVTGRTQTYVTKSLRTFALIWPPCCLDKNTTLVVSLVRSHHHFVNPPYGWGRHFRRSHCHHFSWQAALLWLLALPEEVLWQRLLPNSGQERNWKDVKSAAKGHSETCLWGRNGKHKCIWLLI